MSFEILVITKILTKTSPFDIEEL